MREGAINQWGGLPEDVCPYIKRTVLYPSRALLTSFLAVALKTYSLEHSAPKAKSYGHVFGDIISSWYSMTASPSSWKEESADRVGRILTDGLKHDFILASISFGFGGRIRTQTVTLLSPEDAFKSVFLFFPEPETPEEAFPEEFREIGKEVDLLNRRSPEALPLLIFATFQICAK
jgi:hypothetical protein